VTDPITYGLGVILSSPLIWIGLLLIGGGLLALAWMFRGPLGYYEPEIPAVIQPPTEATLIHPTQQVAPNYRRPDSDTGVVAYIPGATRPAVQEQQQAGPACPICGGPWHALCPSAPKERTEETVALPAVAELAPQLAALARFLNAIDASTEELAVTADVSAELASDGNHTAAAEVDEAILRRVVDGLREPDPEPEPEDDCPLTTQEIPSLDEALPEYETTVRRAQTQDLSAVMEKVRAET
jgi:hypothetical protein